MIWNTSAFKTAHEALLAAVTENNASAVERALEPVKSDLQQLLATPPKSESSREKLSKKIVVIDGEEIELNNAFLNDAARIADELNVDELVAAELAFYAIGDAKRLGVSTFESALALHYIRRQYIIDIIRFGLESLPTDKFDVLLGNKDSRLTKIFEALRAVERNMDDLDDKAKTAQFMGLDKNPELTQVLKLQQEFLVKEHEALGHVLYAYFSVTAETENRIDTLMAILNHLATFSTLDSKILSYFPAMVLWLSAKHTSEFVLASWSYFASGSTTGWKLSFFQSGLALAFYTALADEERSLPTKIEFAAILDSARHAVDASALEFWMCFAHDLKSLTGEMHFDSIKTLVRSRVPEFMFWRPLPSPTTHENFQRAWEILFSGFISNLAEILKEMRLSEEDMYLAVNELENDANAVAPGLDLERFFLFVAIVCRNEPRSSQLFFEDDGDALSGFLQWAANCQVTFMSTTFAELLASLANDETCSRAIHAFLSGNAKKQPAQSDDGFMLSWNSLYDVIEYYIRGMSTSHYTSASNLIPSNAQVAAQFAMPGVVSSQQNVAGATASQLWPQTQQPGQPLGQLVQPSQLGPQVHPGQPGQPFAQPTYQQPGQYLSTVPQPAHSAQAQQVQWGIPDAASTSTATMAAPLTPQLSSLQPQSQLSDDTLLILEAYMSLVSRVTYWCREAQQYLQGTDVKDKTENRQIVPLLFKLLKLQQPIAGSIFAALTPFASQEMWPLLDNFILGKFDEHLLSLQDALSFTRLVEQLSKVDTLSPRLNEYTIFILETVFPWTTAKDEKMTAGLKNIRVQLQLECLEYLHNLLSRMPKHDETAFNICFNAKVYQSIFQVLTTGIDNVNTLDSTHPLVKAVERSVEIVSLLIRFSVPPSYSFDKPVLYHLEVIPHLALYASSAHLRLSLSSITLLSLLDQSLEFKPTIDRQSRILSILSSTTESMRIRIGLMARLEDSGTDLSLKTSLLQMIVRQLYHSGTPRHYMTVAHYLLGFSQSELGLELKLELEAGAGGILSGSSLLSAICDTLLQCILDATPENAELLKLSSEILWYLVKDPLTSEMVLDYLRRFNFWLNTIQYESENIQDSCSAADIYLEYRANMLEIWIREVQLCQKRLLLTIEGHYLDALVPMTLSLLNFTNESAQNVVAFKCLTAWCKLIPVLIASGDSKTGPTFITRIMQILVDKLSEYSRQNGEFAVPVASLLVFLFEKYLERGTDDNVARHMLKLCDVALLSIRPAQVNPDLRTHLYSICFQSLKLVLTYGSAETQQECLRIIDRCGQGVFYVACDDVLGYANEPLRCGALLFLQASAMLSNRLGVDFVAKTLLQYNFVSIFINQVLGPQLNALASTTPAASKALTGNTADDLSTLSASKPELTSLKSKTSSVANGSGSGALIAASGDAKVVPAITTNNVGWSQAQLVKVCLSLLLPVARTRDGAADILCSDLFKRLNTNLSNLPDDVLSMVLQLLIAIVFSLGSENAQIAQAVRDLIDRHKNSVENVMRRDAALGNSLQDQQTGSEVTELARNFTILMSLTGVAK